jgi:SAM-dependent methyltransferase
MSKRLSIISKYLSVRAARILEIGALDNPTFRRPSYNVAYVDYTTREELSKKGGSNPRYLYDKLVDVDYVVQGQSYREVIIEKFDLVVANHVFEHIADPITWLHEIGMLLKPDGYLFLSVPDRRYTFDILRREASVIDLIRAHVHQQVKPDIFHILDHFWYSRPVKSRDVWLNEHYGLLGERRFMPEQVLSIAKSHASQPYADVHCYAYSESSFRTLLSDLQMFSLLGFQKTDIYPVFEMTNEFHVVLHRFSASEAHRVNRLELNHQVD